MPELGISGTSISQHSTVRLRRIRPTPSANKGLAVTSWTHAKVCSEEAPKMTTWLEVIAYIVAWNIVPDFFDFLAS